MCVTVCGVRVRVGVEGGRGLAGSVGMRKDMCRARGRGSIGRAVCVCVKRILWRAVCLSDCAGLGVESRHRCFNVKRQHRSACTPVKRGLTTQRGGH